MNVLFVGLGSIARKHIAALRKLNEDFYIYALRSISGLQTEDGVINIYSLNELNVKIDFVIISNPTSAHISAINTVLELQCPLFIEKPICHKLELEDTIYRINTMNILTYVACNLRFLNCLSYVKKSLEDNSKRLNEVNVYCGSYLPEWRHGSDFREIYSANAEQGGGVHIDLIHELDYLYWFFGIPRQINAILQMQSSLAINACDYANYCLSYNSFCASVILNYYRRDAKRTFELVFDNETWMVDLRANTVTCNGKMLFHSSQSILDTYTEQLSYFIQLVKNQEKVSFNTINDAYNVLKICLANDTQR